ncbi:transglycosylase domain-containing protein [Brevibacillus sp. H7]|uniref:transglycosylase domain-containing protein n=1 Tax=Brevibacillus sp. H7 TaxID=3349138 RepID=UPI0038269D38
MATKAQKLAKKKNSLLLFAVSFLVFLLLSVVGGYFALLYAGEQMIDMRKLEDIKNEASVIYDKNNDEVGTLNVSETREYMPISQMPKHLIDAFIAVEDKRFFDHKGVDIIRVAGAIVNDIRKGTLAEGGSTITQQLARNVFLSQEQTFWRKTKEISIAIGLERKFSKDQIMEMYLNKVYLGKGKFGVEAAAQYYFGKSVTDKNFTVAESAALAAIPKAPTYYSPFGDPEKAKERRDTILRLMYEQGFITLEQKEQAQKEPMPERKTEEKAGMKKGYEAYVDYVVREVEEKFKISEDELYRGGWEIYTSLDPKMQDAMIRAYENPKNFPKDGAKRSVESAMIVVDAKNGGIAAMMGGRNYQRKGWNLAVDMRRQPGSTLKPLAVYAPALDTRDDLNIHSSLSNQRQSFNGYKPTNYDGVYSDSVDLSRALIKSMNVPAVWLLNEIGVETGVEYLKKFGITLEPQDRNLAIALGGLYKGTSPLEMAQAYTAFPNGGVVSKAHAVVKLKNQRMGYEQSAEPKQDRVLKPQTAWDIHTVLERAVNEGTGKAARIKGRHVAGKTGTTQSAIGDSSVNKDAWFVGYTPEYVSAVWMGFDQEDNQHLMRQGSSMTAKLFATVLSEGLRGVKAKDFERPDGVKEVEKPIEFTPLQLAADLTLDNGQMKVVLSWIGGSTEGKFSYDLYRFVDSVESKQLIASGLTEMSYVDTVNEPNLYKYIVVPRDENGTEGPPSNVAEISMTQLENLLQQGELHNDENLQEGEVPIEGEESGQDGGIQDGQDGGSDQENGGTPEQPDPGTPVDGGNGQPTDNTPILPPDIELPPQPGKGVHPPSNGTNG